MEPGTCQKGQPSPGGGSASLCTAFTFGLPVPSVRGFLSGVNDSPLANELVGAVTGTDKRQPSGRAGGPFFREF